MSPPPTQPRKKVIGNQITPGSQRKTTQQYDNTPYTPKTTANPNRGGIIKDSVGNQTPFTRKGRSIALSNYMDEQLLVSMWDMRPPGDSKFQRYLYSELQEGIGVIYGGTTTDTAIKNASLDNWRKFLSKNISQISLDVIFCVDIDIKYVFTIYSYAPLTYDICLAIEEKRINDDFYDYYDTCATLNTQFSYKILNNSLDYRIIKTLDNYIPNIDENIFPLFEAIMETQGPETEDDA